MAYTPTLYRVGATIPINVYDGDRPVCQCHTECDAKEIVRAVNALRYPSLKQVSSVPKPTKEK